MSVTAPPGRREANKAANRAAILAAALQVFSQLGYDAATVRDIVRGTDLATGTFYNYFPDKESVLRALLDESTLRLRERVQAARAAAPDIEAFVYDAYLAYFQTLAEDRAEFELNRRNAGALESVLEQPVVHAGVEELQADLEAAIARGDLPGHDAEMMAAAMAGAGFEIAAVALRRDPPDVQAAARFATDVFLGGIERLRRA